MPVEKREKPILFSTEMVKAILEGRKTQTRRVIKPQITKPPEDGAYFDAYNGGPQWNWWSQFGKQYLTDIIKCPWQVGQELWVRETFAIENIEGCERVIWKADNCARYFKNEIALDDTYYLLSAYKPKRWKPSIFMPRWASRIQLRIKNIRVERVQDISVEDCLKEGIDPSISGMNIVYAFHDLWDSINASRKDKDGNILPYSWKDNPYVWALDFERIK